ncbi:MAG: fatty acyl-AMP ligase, partial [bacterium]|nr:fatty acyl-AMP ligase [bacterium]
NVVMVSYINEFVCSSSSSPHPGLVATGKRSTLHASLELSIVDPDSLEELPENSVGELWIAGPSVAAGYFGKPSLTEDVFFAHIKGAETSRSFLRTGDLAFFEGKEGFLFICGRIKDLIIINGVNVYPQDIEKTAQDSTPAVRPGRVAAFSEDDQSKSGSLIVVFELRKGKGNDPDMACEVIQKAVCASVGVNPSRLVAIPEGDIRKAL